MRNGESKMGSVLKSEMAMRTYTIWVWGVVAHWLEHTVDDRVVAGSNPTEAAWKLWQFPLPHFASVFQKKH